MDIKQLTYFVQVAIDENYTVAARKLFISQPALSKVMKNLEQELGLKLFYYSDKKTKLTRRAGAFCQGEKADRGIQRSACIHP